MMPRDPVSSLHKQAPAHPIPSGNFVLQRTCACGQHASGGGECESCKHKRVTLQRSAVRQSAPDTAPPIVHEVLRSPGQPLDDRTRGLMEGSFGQDFSRVRVHTDVQAAQSAWAVNALAYTVGRDIAFAEGEYRPYSREGQRLIAHELTHTVQQQGAANTVPDSIAIAPEGTSQEMEARLGAGRVAGENAFPVMARSASMVVARQAAPARPGTSRYSESVGPITPSAGNPNVLSGQVTRMETTPTGRIIHRGQVPLEYDEANCRVRIPMRVAFRNPTLAEIGRCPPQS